jgi:predicted ribosomally synthesized peptide with nif11-like leader
MSERTVIAFLQKVHTDDQLRAQVDALPTDRLADLLVLAEQAGFSFSEADWQTVKATSFSDPNELEPDELDQVVGGATPSTGGAAGFFCNLKPTGFFCNSKPNTNNLLNRFGK